MQPKNKSLFIFWNCWRYEYTIDLKHFNELLFLYLYKKKDYQRSTVGFYWRLVLCFYALPSILPWSMITLTVYSYFLGSIFDFHRRLKFDWMFAVSALFLKITQFYQYLGSGNKWVFAHVKHLFANWSTEPILSGLSLTTNLDCIKLQRNQLWIFPDLINSITYQ